VRRPSATQKLEELFERVVAGGDYIDEVQTIHVFGSYARGALEA
jgi:predicted nucleotidyltransferase